MDNRRRFLYYAISEMRGRMWKACAGKEKTGASAMCGGKEKPPLKTRALSGPKKSREACRTCAEKSRYCAAGTRTVNRHRWMGRESQGRREKHCQGTRQNDPVTSGEGVPV